MGLVGITRSTYAEIHKKIGLAIERGGLLELNSGERVVVKINLCDFRMPDTAAVTHPLFLDAILNYLRKSFDKLTIFVVESDATVAQPDLFIQWLGFIRIFEKYNVKWINLTKDKKIKMQINGRFFRSIEVPSVIANSDYLITVPKLKTHLLTKITCCLKNQFGCIPTPKKAKFHPFLDDVIVDACLAMKPDFCIVDGILSMGGIKGPERGIPIHTNIVITGKDPVSVDAVCASIMGFNPHAIDHIRKAQASGVGDMSYEIRPEDVMTPKWNSEYNDLYAWILRYVSALRRGTRIEA